MQPKEILWTEEEMLLEMDSFYFMYTFHIVLGNIIKVIATLRCNQVPGIKSIAPSWATFQQTEQ